MNLWKKFANSETGQPGPIQNKPLAEKIMASRQKTEFLHHDNKVQLKEGEDYTAVS